MTDTTTVGPTFEGCWAIVEQMGHKTIAGFVREVQLAGVPMLRIDVPGPDANSSEPIATQYIHASTLYAMTPTAEAIVRKVAARTRVEPPATWGLTALPSAGFDPNPSGRAGDDDELDQPAEDDEDLLVRMLDERGIVEVLRIMQEHYEKSSSQLLPRVALILARTAEDIEHGNDPVPVADPPPAAPAIVDPDPTLTFNRDDIQF